MIEVTLLQNNILHIEGIEMHGLNDYWWLWRYNWARATVTIVDGLGAPVEAATVHGVWSGDVSWEGERVTQSDGTCVFDSPWRWDWWGQGDYTLTVDLVSKNGYTWDGIVVSETLLYP